MHQAVTTRHNMEPKTHTWIKYNQHKIQHAAHSQHGSSRINRTHNISLMNNTDQADKTKHNIQLTTHTHTHIDQAESTEHRTCHSWTIQINQLKQNTTYGSQHGEIEQNHHNTEHVTHEQYISVSQNRTQHMAHQTQRSNGVNTRHDKQCMKNTDQTICPRYNTKFMTYTEYWSQTSLWVMHALACFLQVKKSSPLHVNLARSSTTACWHVDNINTTQKRKETTCGCIFGPFSYKFRVSLQKRV
jgi:hypothetical protein